MASRAIDYPHRKVTVEEFLDMDFGGLKAELVDGVVVMMAGGNNDHNLVAGNIYGALWGRLRGSGCRPSTSDQAVRTAKDTMLYPDVAIYCGNPGAEERGEEITLGDPKVVFEVFSQSTMNYDQRYKLDDYKALPGVECVVMIAPKTGAVRLIERLGPEAWHDRWLSEHENIPLTCLGFELTRADIFRRD